MKQRNEKQRSVLMLSLLASLLTACGATLPNSAGNCPSSPSMPAVSEPTPSRTYSTSAQQDIQGWQKRLTDLPVTDKP